MREIALTKGRVALVDDQDFEWLSQWKWCAMRQGRDRWRAVRGQWMPETKTTKIVLMHRVIMQPGENETVDHIDGNPLNNTRANLRVATQAQQCMNRRGNIERKTSKYKGVYWSKGPKRWVARFREKHVACCVNEADAALAYDRAALIFDPKFALLNFPGGAL